jgi:hypothetical protein
MTRFSYKTLGLSALVAGAAFFSLGLGTPAQAADVKSPRDAASGLPTGKRQHSPIVITKIEECVSKTDEIDALIASITTQMAQLEARCAELSSLSSEVDAAMASSSSSDAETLAALEEAQRIFSEQVSSFLDEQIAAQVSSELSSSITILQDNTLEMDEEFSVSVAPVQDQLSSLQGMFDAFVEACSSAKKEFKGHVTLLK